MSTGEIAVHPDAAAHSRRQVLLGLGAVVLAVLLFAVSLSVVKWPGIPGSVIGWWRLILSAILWWALLLWRRHRSGTPLPSIATVKLVAPAGLLFGLNITLLFLGLTKTSIAHADFIANMAPLYVVPAGFLIFHERPNWGALRWGLLSVIGLAIVLFEGPPRGVATVRGDILIAGSALVLANYLLVSKWIRRSGVAPWEFMTITMTIALVTATPVTVITAGDQIWPLSWKAWTAVAILSVMTGMVAHGLLYYAQHNVPVSTISIIQTSQPAQSVFWAWLLLGESITVAQIPGMILVTVGLALVVWFSQRT